MSRKAEMEEAVRARLEAELESLERENAQLSGLASRLSGENKRVKESLKSVEYQMELMQVDLQKAEERAERAESERRKRRQESMRKLSIAILATPRAVPFSTTLTRSLHQSIGRSSTSALQVEDHEARPSKAEEAKNTPNEQEKTSEDKHVDGEQAERLRLLQLQLEFLEEKCGQMENSLEQKDREIEMLRRKAEHPPIPPWSERDQTDATTIPASSPALPPIAEREHTGGTTIAASSPPQEAEPRPAFRVPPLRLYAVSNTTEHPCPLPLGPGTVNVSDAHLTPDRSFEENQKISHSPRQPSRDVGDRISLDPGSTYRSNQSSPRVPRDPEKRLCAQLEAKRQELCKTAQEAADFSDTLCRLLADLCELEGAAVSISLGGVMPGLSSSASSGSQCGETSSERGGMGTMCLTESAEHQGTDKEEGEAVCKVKLSEPAQSIVDSLRAEALTEIRWRSRFESDRVSRAGRVFLSLAQGGQLSGDSGEGRAGAGERERDSMSKSFRKVASRHGGKDACRNDEALEDREKEKERGRVGEETAIGGGSEGLDDSSYSAPGALLSVPTRGGLRVGESNGSLPSSPVVSKRSQNAQRCSERMPRECGETKANDKNCLVWVRSNSDPARMTVGTGGGGCVDEAGEGLEGWGEGMHTLEESVLKGLAGIPEMLQRLYRDELGVSLTLSRAREEGAEGNGEVSVHARVLTPRDDIDGSAEKASQTERVQAAVEMVEAHSQWESALAAEARRLERLARDRASSPFAVFFDH